MLCYVEIKTRAFEPRDMGQLGTYIVAVDGVLHNNGDNPITGLLICKTKDNVLDKYETSAINNAMNLKIDNLIRR